MHAMVYCICTAGGDHTKNVQCDFTFENSTSTPQLLLDPSASPAQRPEKSGVPATVQNLVLAFIHKSHPFIEASMKHDTHTHTSSLSRMHDSTCMMLTI